MAGSALCSGPIPTPARLGPARARTPRPAASRSMPDDPPPDQPTAADAPAVLTTAANVGGVARETLFSTTGQGRFGGLVREILISGIGLGGTIAAKSSGRASASILVSGV